MRRQAIRYTAAGTAGVILVLALTVLVNYVAARRYHKFDWTSSKVFTLSEKSLNIVRDLSEPVQAVVFMVPGSPLYDQVHELLDRYAAASPKLTVSYIDPDKEPLKTRELAEKYGISLADTVVFVAGDRTKYVTSDQMADYDYQGMQYGGAPKMKAFKGEEMFTSAILSLVAAEVPTVYVVSGHGEPSLSADGGDMSERGLSVLAEALKRENIVTKPLELFAGAVPADADVVAIIGPTRPYTEAEIAALDAYLDRGGRLLVCLDPLIDPDGTMRTTRLEGFLARRGVTVADDLVIDPSRKLRFYDLSAVYLTDFGQHPVTTGMDGLAVLFTVTRSVSSDDGTALVKTTADGWGETDLAKLLAGQPVERDDADIPGPVAVGVALEADTDHDADATSDTATATASDTDTATASATGAATDTATDAGTDTASDSAAAPASPPDWRLVVFGDSDFLSDVQISNAGNLTLATNAFNWLAARDTSLGIAPRPVEEVSLYLTAQQLGGILLVVLVLMPGAAIVAGIFVWRRRRH